MPKTLIAATLLTAAASAAGDWSQWRGPDRDASSGAEGSLARGWPESLSRVWRVDAGSGQSSPVVDSTTVYVFGREGQRETAQGLDLRTGKVLWRQGYEAPYDVYPGAAGYGSGPRSTPVVHEGRLFTLGISGILTAFGARDGRVLWRRDFAGRFPAQAPPFGTAMSPMMASGLLIVHAGGHEGGALIAFDPATGAERWQLEGDGPSYSSPILTSLQGQQQIVIQVHRRILGVDPAAGRILWSVPFVTPCDQNIVTPLRAGELVVVSSLSNGTQGIRVARRGAEWTAEPAWQTREVSMYMSSPVLVGGRVVGLSHRKRGQYFALDPDKGALVWTSEPGQGENAALVVADGSLLVLQGDGTLLVLPADGESFTPRRRYQVAQSATYAHPVPTSLGILVRDESGISLYGTTADEAARRAGR
jgi:outer membrane protein assembly factor BamB